MAGKKKKGGKKKSKKTVVNRDSELLQAVTNSKLWQNKLILTERQRNDYRLTCQKLAEENETVTNSLYQAERDTIEMVSVLKREDMAKEAKIDQLTDQLEKEKKAAKAAAEKMTADFEQRSKDTEASLHQRQREIALLQKELRNVKEFRRDKARIAEELRDLYHQLEVEKSANEENKKKMEQKFFMEKSKMELEATKKIAQYAEKAQKEAIAAMSETTRKVFKDNVALSDAMKIHLARSEELEEENKRLRKENKRLKDDADLNEVTVQAKIAESRKSKDKILALKSKLENAHTELAAVKHSSNERHALVVREAAQVGHVEREQLKILETELANKDRDMLRLKLLAKKVADQRTTMQRFFIEALDQVQSEIKAARQDYARRAKQNYSARMAAAAVGAGSPPKVKTFSRSAKSTNTLEMDMAAAEEWGNVDGGTDFSALTWEQKEKVIRLLFAKMNGLEREGVKKLPPIQKRPLSSKSTSTALSEVDTLHERVTMDTLDTGSTFITQTV